MSKRMVIAAHVVNAALGAWFVTLAIWHTWTMSGARPGATLPGRLAQTSFSAALVVAVFMGIGGLIASRTQRR